MLCALNRSNELAVHVRGAVNNGASEVEIRETLLQAAIYCGMRMFKFPMFSWHTIPEAEFSIWVFKLANKFLSLIALKIALSVLEIYWNVVLTCRIAAGIEGFKVAEKVINQMKEDKEKERK